MRRFFSLTSRARGTLFCAAATAIAVVASGAVPATGDAGHRSRGPSRPPGPTPVGRAQDLRHPGRPGPDGAVRLGRAGRVREALADLRGLPARRAPWFEVTDQPLRRRRPELPRSGRSPTPGRLGQRRRPGDRARRRRGYVFAGGANGGIFRKRIAGRPPGSRSPTGSSRCPPATSSTTARPTPSGTPPVRPTPAAPPIPARASTGCATPAPARSPTPTGSAATSSSPAASTSSSSTARAVYAATTRGLWRHSTNPAAHRSRGSWFSCRTRRRTATSPSRTTTSSTTC